MINNDIIMISMYVICNMVPVGCRMISGAVLTATHRRTPTAGEDVGDCRLIIKVVDMISGIWKIKGGGGSE